MTLHHPKLLKLTLLAGLVATSLVQDCLAQQAPAAANYSFRKYIPGVRETLAHLKARTVPFIDHITPAGGDTAGGNVIGVYATLDGLNPLYGHGFMPGTTVSVDGVLVSASLQGVITPGAGGSLDVTMPSHAVGSATIVVTDPSGAQVTGTYAYAHSVAVSQVSPYTGVQAGDVLSVTGSGFVSGSTISIDGIALPTSFVNSTLLTAYAPSHAVGPVSVIVTNPDTSTFTFNSITYANPAPCTLPGGGSLASGSSTTGYNVAVISDSVYLPDSCANHAVTTTCNNAALSPAIVSVSCTVTDPNFSSVVLLEHFNSSMTDVTGKVPTANGPVISTANAKFGGASAYFNGGNGLGLTFGSTPAFNFGTGDFTIEGWFYRIDALANYNQAMFSGAYGSSWVAGAWWTGGYSGVSTPAKVIGSFYGGSSIMPETLVTLGTWNHYAWVRHNGMMTAFKDGIAYATSSNTTALGDNNGLVIGHLSSDTVTPSFHGYMDELRITKGVARYSADFAAPTAPFPSQ